MEKMTWQPIETAPRDGTVILLAAISIDHISLPTIHWIETGSAYQSEWVRSSDGTKTAEPTHWTQCPK